MTGTAAVTLAGQLRERCRTRPWRARHRASTPTARSAATDMIQILAERGRRRHGQRHGFHRPEDDPLPCRDLEHPRLRAGAGRRRRQRQRGQRHLPGAALGNLAVGSSATQLNDLIGKWFLGTDHPTLCNTSLVYQTVAGSLFPHTPSHTDEVPGRAGRLLLHFRPGHAGRQQPGRRREHVHQQRRRHVHRPLLHRHLRHHLQLQRRQHRRRLHQQRRNGRLRDRRPHAAGELARASWPTPTTAPVSPTPPTPCGFPWPKRPMPSGTRPARKAATAPMPTPPSRADGWPRSTPRCSATTPPTTS